MSAHGDLLLQLVLDHLPRDAVAAQLAAVQTSTRNNPLFTFTTSILVPCSWRWIARRWMRLHISWRQTSPLKPSRVLRHLLLSLIFYWSRHFISPAAGVGSPAAGCGCGSACGGLPARPAAAGPAADGGWGRGCRGARRRIGKGRQEAQQVRLLCACLMAWHQSD